MKLQIVTPKDKPETHRLRFIVDDIGHRVRVEKGRGRRMPRKLVLATIVRTDAIRAEHDKEPCPF